MVYKYKVSFKKGYGMVKYDKLFYTAVINNL